MAGDLSISPVDYQEVSPRHVPRSGGRHRDQGSSWSEETTRLNVPVTFTRDIQLAKLYHYRRTPNQNVAQQMERIALHSNDSIRFFKRRFVSLNISSVGSCFPMKGDRSPPKLASL